MLNSAAYQRTKVIGRGKFGVVYKGHHKKTKRPVAIKVLDLDTQYDEVLDVQQEIQFLSDLKNAPNVTHYYGLFLDGTKLWIIMDYCEGGSMRTLLKAGLFEEKYIGVIVREVLLALLAVHKIGVIHRDLKAANILVTNEGHVQLCDFGVAAQLTTKAAKRTTIAGTPFWMAPEVIREGDQYNYKADIWSLGITVYEFATGNPPYCDRSATRAMAMIEKQAPPRLEGREYPPALKECIALCLDESPSERPSADDLMKCKLVKQYKSLPASTLKELISRYLLWRDRHSSRESFLVAGEPEDDVSSRSDHLLVKWDFDSLSSREYIMANDLQTYEIEDEEADMPSSEDAHYTMTAETVQYNHSTPESRFSEIVTNNTHFPSTFAPGTKLSEGSQLSAPSRSTAGGIRGKSNLTDDTTNVPKSLISLFEEESSPKLEPFASTNSNFEIPRLPNTSAPDSLLMSSPTIEIPDMESISRIGLELKTTSQLNFMGGRSGSHHQSPQNTFPKLNKPPALTAQYSGNLSDPRLGSPAKGTRQRKKTISNSASSVSTGIKFPEHQAPQTPSRIHDTSLRNTPSPDSALATTIPDASLTNSPSRSMRPRNTSNNPMLQPINFKLGTEHAASKTASKPLSIQTGVSTLDPGLSISASSNNSANTSVPALTSGATSVIDQSKREKPHLHIQMPVPSSAHNALLMLTHEGTDNKRPSENVNQFGINPALVGNVTSMTPVTEKENQMDVHVDTREISTDNSVTLLRPKKGASVTPGPKSAPTSGYFPNQPPPVAALARPPMAQTPRGFALKDVQKFPQIPTLSSEVFLDSTPALKLVSELESMVSLFVQGLESLENSL